MSIHELSTAERLYRFFARPAHIVKVVFSMLIGLGVAVALVAKVYMLVLTDHVCVAESVSLGNKILCINSLELVAYALGLLLVLNSLSGFLAVVLPMRLSH